MTDRRTLTKPGLVVV